MRTILGCALVLSVTLALTSSAAAQFEDPEGGFTSGGSASATASASSSSDMGGGSSDLRLAIQGRLAGLNLLLNPGVPTAVVPPVTAGIRLLDTKLFVGLGVGFGSINDDGPRAWNLTPLATYDLLTTDIAALYLGGWLNFGKTDAPADSFFVGFDFGAGIRGKINEAVSIGAEFGWGLVAFPDPPTNNIANGFFGNIVFEASIGV